MSIAVIGLGKIGLPLAVQFALKGESVIGVDINPQVIEMVNAGHEPFPGEKDLESLLREVVNTGRLRASANLVQSVADSQIIIVVIPLVVDELGNPDFEPIDKVTEGIASALQGGSLVVYETTLPIGTTRSRFAKCLQEKSGLRLGQDLFVAFSPERVLTGRVFSDLRKYPKIVGGVTSNCTERAFAFYRRVLDFDQRFDLTTSNGVWRVASSDAAEFVKLAETTYRDVNIGLANQFAIFAERRGIDVFEVIQAANSQPYSHIHNPGIAVGGHCIPVYPQFYLWGHNDATIVRAARTANAEMPDVVASQVVQALEVVEARKVLIMGATYRAEVPELAFSGIFPLVRYLASHGVHVEVYDPLIDENTLRKEGLPPFRSPSSEFGVVVIQNESAVFRSILAKHEDWTALKIIFDGRDLFQGIPPFESVDLRSLGRGISS
jgi:nucleotide sugar dehydrogenase